MAFGRRKGAGGTTVTTTTTTVHHPPGHDPTKKQGVLSRFGRNKRTRAAPASRATPATRTPATTQRRKTSVGDKVSGGLMKLKGSMTHRPGEKAAGTRRMHGTDGRGSRRVY